MLRDYFARPVLAATVLIGVPALALLWFAGGVVCAMTSAYGGLSAYAELGEGMLPGRGMPLNVYEAVWRIGLAFGAFLGVRAVFLHLRLRWNIFFSQIAAGAATFFLIRLLYNTVGRFNTGLSVWSVIMFVAFLAAFDSLEPERGERWRDFIRVLILPASRRSRWRW
ncbi:MAG: hypothetical protein LBT15_04590 [Synergistaceae bacterium]|nr:hypothetical protein [Synergistaceae bacterium]